MAAFNLIMMLNPIAAVAMAIVAAVALIIANWEPIKAFFEGVWDSVATGFMEAWEPITGFFEDLWVGVIEIFNTALNKIFGFVDKIKGAVSGVVDAASNLGGDVAGFFGFGDDEEQQTGATGPQIVTPQERVARTIEENRKTSTAEVTIKDETGRAELTGGALGSGLQLQSSGAF